MDQSGGGFFPRTAQDAFESLARNGHMPRGFLMIKPLAIRKAQALHLVRRKFDFLQIAQGNARRLEIAGGRGVGNGSRAGRAGHRNRN